MTAKDPAVTSPEIKQPSKPKLEGYAFNVSITPHLNNGMELPPFEIASGFRVEDISKVAADLPEMLLRFHEKVVSALKVGEAFAAEILKPPRRVKRRRKKQEPRP